MKKRRAEKGNVSNGILMVMAGAASYGSLATFVKMAYKAGYSTAEVTVAQFGIGILCLWILSKFTQNKIEIKKGDVSRLLLAGISLGATSVLYYISIQYINASIAVVLLMQSVWMGVLVESIKLKLFPGIKKVFAVLMVLAGTILATNALNTTTETLDIRGVIFGVLAAVSFSMVLIATNTVATYLPAAKRSLYMLYGGGIVVMIFALLTQILPFYFDAQLVPEGFIYTQKFKFKIFLSFGFVIALLGTVIPPLMFNKGFPLTGVGLGSILSATELPVSITVAFFMLGETIVSLQWVGVGLILSAIILLNLNIKTTHLKKIS